MRFGDKVSVAAHMDTVIRVFAGAGDRYGRRAGVSRLRPEIWSQGRGLKDLVYGTARGVGAGRPLSTRCSTTGHSGFFTSTGAFAASKETHWAFGEFVQPLSRLFHDHGWPHFPFPAAVEDAAALAADSARVRGSAADHQRESPREATSRLDWRLTCHRFESPGLCPVRPRFARGRAHFFFSGVRAIVGPSMHPRCDSNPRYLAASKYGNRHANPLLNPVVYRTPSPGTPLPAIAATGSQTRGQ